MRQTDLQDITFLRTFRVRYVGRDEGSSELESELHEQGSQSTGRAGRPKGLNDIICQVGMLGPVGISCQ